MKTTWIAFLIGCLGFFGECDDFFEKDLTGKQLTLIAPGDSVLTGVSRQMFVWEELPGATAYRLVVMTPDFDRPAACLLDTLITGCRYEYDLPAGMFAWGVRAENSVWTSDFTTRSLTVLPLSDEP